MLNQPVDAWKTDGRDVSRSMKLLFVHQNLGALGGAETNIHLTARELQKRGHVSALLHGGGTGNNEQDWRISFPSNFPLPQSNKAAAVSSALASFSPDAIYVHNMSDLEVLQALIDSRLPLVRMV